jgi:restriction system protein
MQVRQSGELAMKESTELSRKIDWDWMFVIYLQLQAKRWQNTIGRPDIQQFVGALAGKGTKKGVFITTSKFSEQAKSYLPADIKVVLIDGDMQSMSILVFLSSVNTKSNA